MKRIVLALGFVFGFCIAGGDISSVEDFRQIDSDKFCAGVSFVKNADDGSSDAGFVIYDASNNSLFSTALIGEENKYFSSYIHSCLSNNESIVLLQASETSPVGSSSLKLALHKVDKDSKSIVFSRDFLSEYKRVYPCDIEVKDDKVLVEVVVDESLENAPENDNKTFVKKVLSFNDEFVFTENSSEKVDNEAMFECYKSRAPFLQMMFKNLSVHK